MITLYGWSAISYWRTPPAIRVLELPESYVDGLPISDASLEKAVKRPRRNASEAADAIYSHLLTDLKGIPLPVHVLIDRRSSGRRSALITPHRQTLELPEWCIKRIDGELAAVSPEVALMQVAPSISLVELICLMDEFCGIYARPELTGRFRVALDRLAEAGKIQSDGGVVCAYCDARGRPLPMTDGRGRSLPWSACANRNGELTGLWKRPPLTSASRLRDALRDLNGHRGSKPASRAAALALDGLGSPLETAVAAIECLPPRLGGEGWPAPSFNRRVELTQRASRLVGATSCVGDQVWEDARTIVEVNGFDYHADRQGFWQHSDRAAALKAMEYRLIEIDYRQLCCEEKLEAALVEISDAVGLPLRPRTDEFRARRADLVRELTGQRNTPEILAACREFPATEHSSML